MLVVMELIPMEILYLKKVNLHLIIAYISLSLMLLKELINVTLWGLPIPGVKTELCKLVCLNFLYHNIIFGHCCFANNDNVT